MDVSMQQSLGSIAVLLAKTVECPIWYRYNNALRHSFFSLRSELRSAGTQQNSSRSAVYCSVARGESNKDKR